MQLLVNGTNANEPSSCTLSRLAHSTVKYALSGGRLHVYRSHQGIELSRLYMFCVTSCGSAAEDRVRVAAHRLLHRLLATKSNQGNTAGVQGEDSRCSSGR